MSPSPTPQSSPVPQGSQQNRVTKLFAQPARSCRLPIGKARNVQEPAPTPLQLIVKLIVATKTPRRGYQRVKTVSSTGGAELKLWRW
jgi:hypothetical protein